MSERICLVEDDATIREIVKEKLERKGYQVDAFDRAEAVPADKLAGWDLYILDVMLKGSLTGLDLCQKIRGHSATLPVLILSALSEPGNRVEGLKVGADDYLTKPFEMEELLLRVDGMLKRRSWYRTLPQNRSVYRWEDNEVDFVKLEGRRGDQRFPLSQKECMLMKLLVEREGEVVSRDEILNQVWGYNAFPSHRTVDNFIVRLRKYFEPSPAEPRFIHSVRGLGYKFTR